MLFLVPYATAIAMAMVLLERFGGVDSALIRNSVFVISGIVFAIRLLHYYRAHPDIHLIVFHRKRAADTDDPPEPSPPPSGADSD